MRDHEAEASATEPPSVAPLSHSAVTRDKRPLLPALTGIRGFAAAWVLLKHFWEPITSLLPGLRFLEPWAVSGTISLDAFFILSGFIISYNYADQFLSFSRTTYRSYLVNRFARIYPVHFLTMIGGVILVVGAVQAGIERDHPIAHSPLSFVWSVLMLDGIMHVPAYNPPAWSVSLEFVAYLFFPLIAVGMVKLTSARSAFVVAGIVSMVGTAGLLAIGHWINPASTGAGMAWVRVTSGFLAGCLLWAGWSRLKEPQGPWGDRLVLVGVLGMFAVFTIINARVQFSPEGFAAFPFVVIFVLGVAAATGPAARILGNRVAVWAGKISYSIYLTHFLLLLVITKLYEWEPFEESNIVLRAAVIASYLGGAVLLGHLTFHVLEEPGRRLVRKHLLREGPPVVLRPAPTS